MKSNKRPAKSLERYLSRFGLVTFEDYGYKVASVGLIAAGLVASLASTGVGLGLILTGTTVLSEA